jgi:hypothetical protein
MLCCAEDPPSAGEETLTNACEHSVPKNSTKTYTTCRPARKKSPPHLTASQRLLHMRAVRCVGEEGNTMPVDHAVTCCAVLCSGGAGQAGHTRPVHLWWWLTAVLAIHLWLLIKRLGAHLRNTHSKQQQQASKRSTTQSILRPGDSLTPFANIQACWMNH